MLLPRMTHLPPLDVVSICLDLINVFRHLSCSHEWCSVGGMPLHVEALLCYAAAAVMSNMLYHC
jgi:hypothetical protein